MTWVAYVAIWVIIGAGIWAAARLRAAAVYRRNRRRRDHQ